jgi:hypothetical protein
MVSILTCSLLYLFLVVVQSISDKDNNQDNYKYRGSSGLTTTTNQGKTPYELYCIAPAKSQLDDLSKVNRW